MQDNFGNKFRNRGFKIGNDLITIPGSNLILLEGSIASGQSDGDSDLDLLVMSSKLPSINQLEAKLIKFANRISVIKSNSSWLQIRFYYDEIEVNIGFGFYKEFKKRINSLARDPGNYLKFIYQKNLLNWIFNTIPIYDRYNILKLKKRIRLTKAGRKNVIFKYYKELYNTFIPKKSPIKIALKRSDYPYIQYLFHDSVEKILNIIFTLNNEYYNGYPKWAIKKMKQFKIQPDRGGQLIQKICIMGNEDKSFKRKVNLFKQLFRGVGELLERQFIAFHNINWSTYCSV